jgi:hypothetical protein
LALVFWLIERANEETLRLTRQPLTSGPGFGAIEVPGLAPAPAETVLPPGAEYSAPPSMAEPSVAEPSGAAGDEPPAAPSDTVAHTSPSAPEENA